MENWNLQFFVLVLAAMIVRWIRRDGARNILRSMRIWGDGVTPEQRRENVIALVGLLVLLILGVLS